MPTPEILPRLKSSFGTSCGGQLSELFKNILNEVFCEAGGENQPHLIKVGVDSPTKKRWDVFQNPFLKETYLNRHVFEIRLCECTSGFCV